MSTTNLFVELIVIGVGALAWFVLAILSIFGYEWLLALPADKSAALFAAIPLLAFTYLLGIITDRLSDGLFEKLWTDDLRNDYFDERVDYYNARRIVLTKSERLAELLEYGRSRLRICRGWAFNAILIVLALNLFIWLRLPETAPRLALTIAGSIIFLLIAWSCQYAWKKLSHSEYRKVKEQAAFMGGAGR